MGNSKHVTIHGGIVRPRFPLSHRRGPIIIPVDGGRLIAISI